VTVESRHLGRQGCQLAFVKPDFEFFNALVVLKIKKPYKIELFLAFFLSERHSSGKTPSELHIHYKYLLTRVYDHAECKEYCKDLLLS